MERTAKGKQKPLWRKKTLEESDRNIGKLYLRTFRKGMIKPNEKIRALAEELSGYRQEFVLIDPGDYDLADIKATSQEFDFKEVEEQVKAESKEPKKEEGTVPSEEEPKSNTYTIKHSGGGWYDVFSEAGKKMNEGSLRSKDAQELKKQLETESIVEE